MQWGTSLKVERERLGVPLEAVAEGTKVSLRHLEALEEGDLSELPGGIFSRGIVQGYCRFLGMDDAPWLAHLASLQPKKEATDFVQFAEAVKRTRLPSEPLVRRRWWGVVAMMLLLVAVTGAAWQYVVRPRVVRPVLRVPPPAAPSSETQAAQPPLQSGPSQHQFHRHGSAEQEPDTAVGETLSDSTESATKPSTPPATPQEPPPQ